MNRGAPYNNTVSQSLLLQTMLVAFVFGFKLLIVCIWNS